MKFTRKAGVLGLSAAILLSAFPPLVLADSAPSSASAPTDSKLQNADDSKAAAEAKIGKDQAIELARKAVDLPDGYTVQNVNFNTYGYPGRKGLWNLGFVKKDGDRYVGNVNVGIDADTGRLLNYNNYNGDPAYRPTYPPKTDLAGAKTKAAEILAKFNPGEKDSVVYNDEFERMFIPPLNGDVRYTIKYDRNVNGVRFPQNYITITIDGNGNLSNYEFNWNENAKFESATPAIKAADAEKAYKDKVSASLQYILLYNKGGPSAEPTLSYSLSPLAMDAQTGGLLNWNGSPAVASQDLKPLTTEPLAPKPAGNLNLTKEQAAAKATALVGIPENAKLQDANYYENPENPLSGGSSSWNFTWTVPGKTDKDQPQYYRAAINTKTGDLTSYGKDFGPVPFPTSGNSAADLITAEAAQQKAADFVKKVLPHYSNQLAIVPQAPDSAINAKMAPQQGYYVSFRRLVNGIASEFENLSVTVSLTTGEIQNYWGDLSTYRYPDNKPAVIPVEQAKDLLMAQNKLELVYTQYEDISQLSIPYYTLDRSKISDNPAKLVYRPATPVTGEQLFLDAVSGKWRKRDNGDPASTEKVKATDIDKHWAQKELQLMIDYKAIDVKDGKVNPDQIITRGELIKILVISMNGGGYRPMYDSARKASFADVTASSAYFGYVEQAVDANILDKSQTNFNPDSKITREELAVLLVRALGLNKLASFKDLFTLKVEDAAKIESKGQVALVTGLGILSTFEDGNFNPAQEVTRAQAATAFFRYLQKKSELQDNSILK